MASKIIEVIAKESNLLELFIKWYSTRNTIIPIKQFVTLPFEYQCGVLISWFEEEYNYGVVAEKDYYTVVYLDIQKAKDIITKRPGRILSNSIDNVEYADFTSSMISTLYNYERGMIKIVDLIINPF